jgi:lactate dehydrogenase-like 2-hydroxyacid dehydrogenase
MSAARPMTAVKPEILVIHTSAPKVLPGLEERFIVHRPPEGGDRDAFVAGIAEHIRALLVSTFFGADAALIGSLPNLEIVVNGGGHYDSTDVDAVRARGLSMTYTPRVTTGSCAPAAGCTGPWALAPGSTARSWASSDWA